MYLVYYTCIFWFIITFITSLFCYSMIHLKITKKVSNYRGDYTGKLTDRPKQIRPRSAHRDTVDNTSFYDDTTAGKSYRKFSELERKSARLRIKRIGSSHGHVEIKNSVKFGGASTHHDDYQKLPYEKSTKILPAENNIKFGLHAGDNATSYSKFHFIIVVKIFQIFIICFFGSRLYLFVCF